MSNLIDVDTAHRANDSGGNGEFVERHPPGRIEAVDRVGMGVEIFMQAERISTETVKGILGHEAAEGRIHVAGTQVVEPDIGVKELSCIQVLINGHPGFVKQISERIVGVGIGDGLAGVGQGACAAEAVGMIVADHAVAGLTQEVVPVGIAGSQAVCAVAFFQ